MTQREYIIELLEDLKIEELENFNEKLLPACRDAYSVGDISEVEFGRIDYISMQLYSLTTDLKAFLREMKKK